MRYQTISKHASESDIREIANVISSVMSQGCWHIVCAVDTHNMAKWIRDILHSYRHPIIVAARQGIFNRIVGVGIGHEVSMPKLFQDFEDDYGINKIPLDVINLLTEQKTFYIADVAVLPKYCRRGIASAILEKIHLAVRRSQLFQQEVLYTKQQTLLPHKTLCTLGYEDSLIGYDFPAGCKWMVCKL
ncbi:MAG TPA: GNAT family N-acetyltransferase [Candidatus Pacearchaeota archaeon]|nr:GNAT family N-acetyltransferase [Candidatus Pacearchaeota archaeon]